MKLPKELTLAEIAVIAGGQVKGPADTKVASVALDPFAAGVNELAILFDPKLLRRISECKAGAVVVPAGAKTDLPRVEVERPLLALARMLKVIQPKRFLPPPGVHPTAVVDPTSQLGADVAIGPYVVIGPQSRIGAGTVIMAGCSIGGRVVIGENCLLHPSCLIADYVQIGSRVIMQQGVNIGGDGFGYVTERPSNIERRLAGILEDSNESNPLVKIPQIGTVIVEDDVEFGCYTTVDRATMGATIIGRGSKFDNLVMVAHNVRIGHEVIMVAHAGVAGSSVIGDRAVIAGYAAIKDHVKIGADAIVEACSGVMRDVPAGEVVGGIPSVPAREYFTNTAHIRRLPQMSDELKSLKKRVAELERLLTGSCSGAEGD